MTYSRRQLYAMGETFGTAATVRLPGGGLRCGGGGGSESNSTTGATTSTVNTDKRVAVQDGVGITGDGNSTNYNVNDVDAVKFIAQAGADMIKSSGGAVVDLYDAAGKRNADTWNATMTTGAALIDKLLDKSSEAFSLSNKVVDSFQPNENKNTDAIKTAAIAAGVIGVAALFAGKIK